MQVSEYAKEAVVKARMDSRLREADSYRLASLSHQHRQGSKLTTAPRHKAVSIPVHLVTAVMLRVRTGTTPTR